MYYPFETLRHAAKVKDELAKGCEPALKDCG
jgi:hypothetical protein